MLAIAIPLIMSIRIQMKQKIILLFIFGMGAFVIVAALLTKLYCLVPSLISYVYINWYFREASVGLYVTNLPSVWSLIREVFPSLRSSIGSKRYGGSSKNPGNTHSGLRQWNGTGPRSSQAGIGMKSFATSRVTKGDDDEFAKYGRTASMERINKHASSRADDESSIKSGGSDSKQWEIKRDVTFTVETQPADIESQSGGSKDARSWNA